MHMILRSEYLAFSVGFHAKRKNSPGYLIMEYIYPPGISLMILLFLAPVLSLTFMFRFISEES